MPAKSGKQYRFMAMIAHDKKGSTGLKGIGPSKAVAKHFVEATPKKKKSMFMRGHANK